jgi:dihydrofolate reductase
MINAIFACDLSGGIGFNGSLPWPHVPEDMAHFQKLTKNQIVVMGRRTWDDPKMPKPLLDRTNYIITNRPIGVYNAHAICGEDYVDQIVRIHDANPGKDVFIIGGKQVLEDCKNILDKVYLTYIKGTYRIDTRMNLRSFLGGFAERYATSSEQCTIIRYESIFKRSSSSP